MVNDTKKHYRTQIMQIDQHQENADWLKLLHSGHPPLSYTCLHSGNRPLSYTCFVVCENVTETHCCRF